MDEQHFDSLRSWQPFQCQDDQVFLRLITIARGLWGRTTEDLRRQLLAPTPAIPAGCTLKELEQLGKNAEQMLRHDLARRRAFLTMPSQLRTDEFIVIGSERLSTLEARLEVARRAIHKLRKRNKRGDM